MKYQKKHPLFNLILALALTIDPVTRMEKRIIHRFI